MQVASCDRKMTPIGRKHSRGGLLRISGDILGDLEGAVDLCDALIGSRANRIKLAPIRQTEDLENTRSGLKAADDGKVAIGKLKLLPALTLEAICAAREATASYDGMVLTIAVAYGGREEIADAVQALLYEEMHKGATLADAIEQITPAAISRHLYMAGSPDPDLIIRTSGEIRLSGFLLWQSVHSEFYFSDVYWPAFRKIDFLRAVRAYQQRKRRFGR